MSTFLTLDGVMQAPGGPGEDDSGGFTHGGWSVTYWDEQLGQVMGEAISTPFDLVLGRKTYDIVAAYWPHATDEIWLLGRDRDVIRLQVGSIRFGVDEFAGGRS